ncbi:MAG: hypothetical protein JKY56_13565 [Kofleriaceae bacterium]|nr:hypothetical protein [Kofleriaceae bacterium]
MGLIPFVSYQQAYRDAWKQGPAAALAFLRAVFHHPGNQHVKGEPSDYLSDEDEDEGKLTPAQGFDKMQAEFCPRQSVQEKIEFIMECLVERRTSDQDQGHRVTPFNALLLTVGTYDWGDATLSSIHYNPESGAWKLQYGLNHELIEQSDNYREDSDWYTFIYDLAHSDHYKLCYEGEALEGEMLFSQIRAAQYALYLEGLVDVLATQPSFADFPKTQPLHFLIDESEWAKTEGTLEHKIEWRAPLDAASIEDSELLQRYVAAAVPPPELSRDDRWLYLLKSIREPKSPQYAQLIEALASDSELMAWSFEIAQGAVETEKQQRGGAPSEQPPDAGKPDDRKPDDNAIAKAKIQCSRVSLRAWAYLFWSIPANVPQALTLTKSILALPSPVLSVVPRGKIEERSKSAISELFGTWKFINDSHKEECQEEFEAARKRMQSVETPVFRVLFAEQEMRLKHGVDAAKPKRWGVAYNLEYVSNTLIDAVVACVDELLALPDSERDFDFLLTRLLGLGIKAQTALPGLLRCLDEIEPGSYRTNRLLDDLPKVFFDLGLNTPPKRIREHIEGQQYHNFDFYKAWATQVPKALWLEFVQAFETDSSGFNEPGSWMKYLSEGKHAEAIFVAGILQHKGREAMLSALGKAVSSPAPLLLKELLYSIAEHYFGKTKTRNLPKVVELLADCAELDQANQLKLRQSELVLYRGAADSSKLKGTALVASLAELQERYSDSPALYYCRAELALHAGGAEACGTTTLKALQTLSAEDLVYRKAVFQFAGIDTESWNDATPFHGYAVYQWAATFFAQDSYRDGAYSDGPQSIDRDLFYRALENIVAPLTNEERYAALASLRAEYDFGPTLHTAQLAELSTALTDDNWNINYQICKKLVAVPLVYTDELLKNYSQFRDDETRRRALVALMWPIEELRMPLLADPAFQGDLATFITAYPGATKDTCDLVFSTLAKMGQHEVILATAEDLNAHTIIASFLNINRGIQALGAFDRGVALLDRILGSTSPKKPDFVLLTTNKGVLQFQQGNAAEAERTFETLFAMDWSRFDYKEDDDNFMAEILGGDLDAQLRDVFKQYYAMAKYNAACIYATRSGVQEAVSALHEATELYPPGYPAKKIQGESDFAPIKTAPAFVALIKSLGESQ